MATNWPRGDSEGDSAHGRDLDLSGAINLGEIFGLNNSGLGRGQHLVIVNGQVGTAVQNDSGKKPVR